jgi:hypothetical protein
LKQLITCLYAGIADPDVVFLNESGIFKIKGRSLAEMASLPAPDLVEVFSCFLFCNVGINPKGRHARINPLSRVLGRS